HVNIAEIAKTMRYSQKYMDRVFRAETGLTMKKYASIIQIQTAIRYLQEGRIDDVYEGLGYYDQSYFIREFKKNTSVTPGQFCREEQISIV
ncbi:MAG: AraC family transcriptional regulator, partial [Clostridiales bacterium]|nr:AraC family transcriptional regulator [Clostridiales bacterium]